MFATCLVKLPERRSTAAPAQPRLQLCSQQLIVGGAPIQFWALKGLILSFNYELHADAVQASFSNIVT